MAGPFDYSTNIPNPASGVMQGVQFGVGLQQLRTQQEQQSAALQMQRQMNSDLGALAAKENPTAQDYASLMTRYPHLGEKLKQSWDVLDKGQQQAKLGVGYQAFSAVRAGRPELAKQLFQQRADAIRAGGGAEQQATEYETMAKMVEASPSTAATTIGLFLSSADPDKFATSFGQIGQETRAADAAPAEAAKRTADTRLANANATKAEAEAGTAPERLALDRAQAAANIDNLRSQIQDRGARLGLDQERLNSDIDAKLAELAQKGADLPESARKVVNESSANAVVARQASSQLTDLAGQFERADPNAFGAAPWEFVKRATGQQDYVSSLRREYLRLRASEVGKALPPGAASDADVALALSGFPSETAQPTQIVGFLRGMAKLKDYEAKVEDARSEWVSAVGHAGKAKRDLEVSGVMVPAGTTFADFAARSLKTPGAAVAPPQRSYLRFAQ